MFLFATLNARLQPMHRADLEDAFDSSMAKFREGLARVVGGSTIYAPNHEVMACEIDLEVDDPSPEMIDTIKGLFEAMLAPKGSYLHNEDHSLRIDFGTAEGLALYLNGKDLPDEVYKSCDSNHVYAECDRLLDGIGRIHSYRQGGGETALYMYGSNFQLMRTRIMPLLETYPLCQPCRIEQIA